MKKYKLICMGFDGEYVTEHPVFNTIDEAWEYSNDLGSKWFFYPFHFVINGKSIADAPEPLDYFNGKRIKTISRTFENHSKKTEMIGADIERFIYSL